MHYKGAEIPNFLKASCINASSLSLIIKKARGQFDKKVGLVNPSAFDTPDACLYTTALLINQEQMANT